MMEPSKEKYYQPGITSDRERIERELELPSTPVLDYPEHNTRHRRRFIEAEWIEPRAPRVEAFVNWCIDHQTGLSVALWALIAAGVGWLIVVW